MRRVMWFTIGFTISCFLNITFFWNHPSITIAVLCCAAAFGFLLISVIKRKFWLRILSVALAGLGIGFFWMTALQRVYLLPVSQLDGQIIHTNIAATTYSTPSRYSSMFDGTLNWEGHSYQVRVYQNAEEEIIPGDLVESDYRFRLTTPGGLKESSFYQGNGYFLVASQKGEMCISRPEKHSLRDYPAIFANQAKQLIHSLFAEEDAAFAQALLLGDTDELSYSMDTALKISGIRHIVAVSGLHISILYGLLHFLLRRHRFLGSVISSLGLTFFAAIAGFTPSVTRACIMTGLMSFATFFDREYDSPTGLSFACLMMLAVNPFQINSVSFQLSVASVISILIFSTPIQRWLAAHCPKRSPKTLSGKLIRWGCASASVTLGAMLLTTPLTAYYFGTVSLVGLLTNLLTLPAVTGIFFLISLCCFLGALFPTGAVMLAAAASWLIHYVTWIARTLSAFPLAAVYTQSKWTILWLVVCYILIALYLLCGRRYLKRYLLSAAVMLAVCVSLSWLLPKTDEFRMTAMDVGEGQGILLQSKGHTLLVDCGGDVDEYAADEISQTLLSQGIRTLDAVVLTHYDRDHSGALLNLLTRIKVKRFYLPDEYDRGLTEQIANCSTASIHKVSENMEFELGQAAVSLYQTGILKTENENCICVLFGTEKCAILITGDRSKSGEKRLIKQVDLPDVDILVAGHHGSKNSTSEELLNAVTPEIVVISVGASNSYGHPAEELLERLNDHGCTVYRTDTQGAITIRR